MVLSGCSPRGDGGGETRPGEAHGAGQAPVYERNTTVFQLAENANPYMTDYGADGFFYFVMGTMELDESEEEGGQENAYQFYYQPYDSKPAIPFCAVTDGYVRDFSTGSKDGGMLLSVLRIGEEACILEYDGAGKQGKKIVLDERFNSLEEFPALQIRPEGGYVIGLSDQAYFLDAEGNVTGTVGLRDTVRELYLAGEPLEDQELYALVENNQEGRSERFLLRLNEEKKQAENVRELPDDVLGVHPFSDGFVSVYRDRIAFFSTEKEGEEVLVDLDRQGLLASQIQYVFGSREEIKLVSVDPSAQDPEAYLFALREQTDPDKESETKKEEQELYAPDGRRIVRVAIPKEYIFQVEFHAKKYNQTSDKSVVEVERFEGSLEDYLGKGNRPDVIMFTDQTEVAAYVQKGVLVDLLPLFEGQEKYSLEGIIPKARELLGFESADSMYAMAGRFQLLLRTSDGTEYDTEGKCDVISYLKWYDNYLTENGIGGMGMIENLLYANVGSFYDENTAEASFMSAEFRELMEAYKEVSDRHKGDVDRGKAKEEKGWTGEYIAWGPRWCLAYLCFELAEGPNVKKEGLPGLDGEDRVYMKLDHPMSILNTSDCQEAAFDFILYYSALSEYLMLGDTESSYGKNGNTDAIFSVYEEVLREEIYESERAYLSSRTLGGVYFTEEQLDQLSHLIDSAVPNTEAQREIYAMLMEAMDPYLQGGKDLDSACEVLQSRAELYLKERR